MKHLITLYVYFTTDIALKYHITSSSYPYKNSYLYMTEVFSMLETEFVLHK